MSNQVYQNNDYRYDLANTGTALYEYLTSQAIVTVTPTQANNFTLTKDLELVVNKYISYDSGTFTINKDGLYSFSFNVVFANDAQGEREHNLVYTPISTGVPETLGYVNGNQSVAVAFYAGASNVILNMFKGDTISTIVYQATAGDLNLIGGAGYPRTQMIISRIA